MYSGGQPSASGYVAMLRAVGPAIKAVDPNAEIVTAGLPDSRLSKPNLFKYIQQMYSAGGEGDVRHARGQPVRADRRRA